jgi:hypothetical protein
VLADFLELEAFIAKLVTMVLIACSNYLLMSKLIFRIRNKNQSNNPKS